MRRFLVFVVVVLLFIFVFLLAYLNSRFINISPIRDVFVRVDSSITSLFDRNLLGFRDFYYLLQKDHKLWYPPRVMVNDSAGVGSKYSYYMTITSFNYTDNLIIGKTYVGAKKIIDIGPGTIIFASSFVDNNRKDIDAKPMVSVGSSGWSGKFCVNDVLQISSDKFETIEAEEITPEIINVVARLSC